MVKSRKPMVALRISTTEKNFINHPQLLHRDYVCRSSRHSCLPVRYEASMRCKRAEELDGAYGS